MDQYSEEHSVHQQYGEQSFPDTLKTSDVESNLCKVLEAKLKACGSKARTIAQWTCVCGKEEFRVFAKDYSTIAQCLGCGNEKEIHEG